MDGVAQGWLVYALTGSALWLGWVSAARSVSLLIFSLYGGLLSDRFPKRSILIGVRWARLFSHLAVAVLISTGAIRVWHLALRSLLSGLLLALIMPAERAIVPELVDRRALLNAFALTSVATGLMGMLGAAAAGALIDVAGVAVVYYAIVAFHLLTALLVAQLPMTPPTPAQTPSLWHNLLGSFAYGLHQPVLRALLGLALAVAVLARPYTTLMPTFAKEVMGFEAAGLGLLTAAPQLGSVLSALAMAALGRFQAKGKLLLGAGVGLGLALLGLGNVRLLGLVLPLLVLTGAAYNVCYVGTQTLLQLNADSRYLGRVMSLQIMMTGLTPLGTLPAATLADRHGAPLAISALGGSLLLVFLGAALAKRELRGLA
jgi:MFS family permease